MPLIKDYVVSRKLGEGGAATVYLAHHEARPDVLLAIKVLRVAARDLRSLERFNDERVILNHLRHPHIATIMDQGVTEQGQPFLAMTYWPGMHITDYADHHRLDLRQRLALFLQLTDIVSFAHRNLVLHRDIKPGNVLVTPSCEVKLLDFGIAKVLTENPKVTALQDSRATLAYASPEQVRGDSLSVTSEVYSLGILLYELLTGSRPYELGTQPLENIRVICEEETPQPSVHFQKMLSNDSGTTPPEQDTREWLRQIKGDLDTLVNKALAKSVAKRYPTVEALSEDIQRYLGGLPIHAKRPTLGYRLNRFIKRHRVFSFSLAASMVVLVGTMISFAFMAHQNRIIKDLTVRQNERAVAERETAEKLTSLMTGVFALPDSQQGQGEQVTASTLLKNAYKRTAEDLKNYPRLQERFLASIFEAQGNLGLDQQAYETNKVLIELQEKIYGLHSDEAVLTLINLSPMAAGYEGIQRAITYAERAFTGAKELGSDYYLYTAGLMLANYSFMGPTSVGQPEAYADQVFALLEDHPMSPYNKMILFIRMGDIYLYIGNFEKALAVSQRARDICQESCGDDHQMHFSTTAFLAKVLGQLGRYQEAIDYAEEAIGLGERYMPEASRTYEEPGLVLAEVYKDLHQFENSERHYWNTLEKVEKLGGLTRYIYRIRFDLSQLYRDWGRFKDAYATVDLNLDNEEVRTTYPFIRYISQWSRGVTLDELGLEEEAGQQLLALLQTDGTALSFEDRITSGFLGGILSRENQEPEVASWVFHQATQAALTGAEPSDWDFYRLKVEQIHHAARTGRANQVRCLLIDLDHELSNWDDSIDAYAVYEILNLYRHLLDRGLHEDGRYLRQAMEGWPAVPAPLSMVNQWFTKGIDLFPSLGEEPDLNALDQLEQVFAELAAQDYFPQKRAIAQKLMAVYHRLDRPQDAKRVEQQLWSFLKHYQEDHVTAP